MSLSKSKTSTKRKAVEQHHESPALAYFHRQWQAIEKLQAKLAKQEQEGADIYQRFVSDIEPLEREQCALIFQLCQRLAGFTARKSFTQWQREMLHGWIDELMGYLESNPFRGELDLESLYMAVQSGSVTQLDDDQLDVSCDFITDMLQDAFGESPDDIELLREMVRNPEKLRDYMQAQAQKLGGDEHATRRTLPMTPLPMTRPSNSGRPVMVWPIRMRLPGLSNCLITQALNSSIAS